MLDLESPMRLFFSTFMASNLAQNSESFHCNKIIKTKQAPLTTEKQTFPYRRTTVPLTTREVVPLRGIITFPHEVHAAKGALAYALKEPREDM